MRFPLLQAASITDSNAGLIEKISWVRIDHVEYPVRHVEYPERHVEYPERRCAVTGISLWVRRTGAWPSGNSLGSTALKWNQAPRKRTTPHQKEKRHVDDVRRKSAQKVLSLAESHDSFDLFLIRESSEGEGGGRGGDSM